VSAKLTFPHRLPLVTFVLTTGCCGSSRGDRPPALRQSGVDGIEPAALKPPLPQYGQNMLVLISSEW
jgi:hypothetical protein